MPVKCMPPCPLPSVPDSHLARRHLTRSLSNIWNSSAKHFGKYGVWVVNQILWEQVLSEAGLVHSIFEVT